jgi:hypothetical protein
MSLPGAEPRILQDIEMNLPISINLDEAKRAFVVANTPLYLARRLQQDSNVRKLSDLSGDELLKLYTEAVTRSPVALDELVIPYVCLAALSLQGDLRPLKMTTGIRPAPGYKWLDYIQQVLIQSYNPTSNKTFAAPRAIDLGLSTQSHAPIRKIVFHAS